MMAHADTEKNPNTIQYLQAITPAARQMVAALRSHGVQTLRNLHRCSTSTVVATPQTRLHKLAALIDLHEAGRLRQHARAADEPGGKSRHAG